MEINMFFKNLRKKIMKIAQKEKILKKGESVFLKVPNQTPREIVIDLPSVLEKENGIKAAYLAEGFLESGEEPHYIVGIEPTNCRDFEISHVMEKLGKDIHRIIPQTLYVDFIQLDDRDTEINKFMKEYLIPFYTKR